MLNIRKITDEQAYKFDKALNNVLAVENGAKREDINEASENRMSSDVKQLLDSAGIARDSVQYEKNANEIMHTANTGYGAELVPDQILSASYLDLIPKFARLLSMLPGFHGSNMGKKETVPIIGDAGFFQGNAEVTTGALALSQGTNRLPTAEIDIEQAPFILSMDISRRLLNYSLVDLEMLIKIKLAEAGGRTFDAVILNGDSEAGSSGNVNSDDQAPATTFAAEGGANYYALMIDHGIRELAINGSGLTVNVGSFDFADLLTVANLIGDLFSDPSQCLWLFNRATYTKALGITEFKDMSQNGRQSTVHTGALTNILGADLITPRDMGKTEADGKKSATGSNNTLGQFGIVYKPAVQYGYGQPVEIDAFKIPGKGIQLVATAEFGYAIAQLKAGQTDSSVGLGINVTV